MRVFSMGKIFGTPEENEETAEEKNVLGFIKNVFSNVVKPKEEEEALTDYQIQLLEELGLRETANE